MSATNDPRAHWDDVYRTKRPDEVSWYRPHLELSLKLIEMTTGSRDSHVIDVGGGESTLVDDLLADGYRNVAVLDISTTAIEVAKTRLGKHADEVKWLCGDVRTFPFASHEYEVWHDRAVFHFLTDPGDRAAYVRQVGAAVKPRGYVIVAAFGPEGPTKCSGLDVVRYDPEALHEQFGPQFRLVQHLTELHQTPAGVVQQFIYCQCKVE